MIEEGFDTEVASGISLENSLDDTVNAEGEGIDTLVFLGLIFFKMSARFIFTLDVKS